jgi:hypothetical protein
MGLYIPGIQLDSAFKLFLGSRQIALPVITHPELEIAVGSLLGIRFRNLSPFDLGHTGIQQQDCDANEQCS